MKTIPKHDVFADTWAGTDALGRRLPGFEACGPPRPDRFAGIFYFICNNHRGPEGPFDVTKTIASNPADPPFEPGKPYYWGEPELGYYLSTDKWVIRRHAYLLADAGVDTLIFDLTNDVTFPEAYTAVCEVFTQVRQEGEKTPSICFLASEKSIEQLWENLYSKDRFKDLWFQWKGKPLLIFGQWEKRGDMNQVVLPQHIQDFFTLRKSWAWDSLPWYGENGYHRWPWVAHNPQCVGWDKPEVAEMVPAAVGQHPLSNIGRSFSNGQQPPTNEYDLTEFTHLGLYFNEQWQRVFEVDPEFVFITGWNEWIAGAAICEDPSQAALQALWDFFPGAVLGRAGKQLEVGDKYFIDQYNQEYSRDAEPMRGGHTDNYYYQMAANIRRFKGVRQLPVASAPLTIDLEGSFDQWLVVTPKYYDHQFETLPRHEPGWGGAGIYHNETGRNEFITMQVARDAHSIYFLAQTRQPITPNTDTNWMMLFLNTDQRKDTGWEGYDYLINWPPMDARRTSVLKYQAGGGWDTTGGWESVGEATYRVEGCNLMLAVPRRLLGLEGRPLAFDFHWVDNLQRVGDIEEFFNSGDSAPSRRFDYTYQE